MPALLQLNMTRGELTPYLHSRIDLDHYRAGMARMRNWIPLRFGGMTRCPGTLYMGPTEDAAVVSRLLPFQFSRAQVYVLEFGDTTLRFWTRAGQVMFSGSPYEIVSPYTEAMLSTLKLRQLGDLVYFTGGGLTPKILTRTSETSWAFTDYIPLDGPYLDVNATDTTLTPSATTGSITWTASAVTGINGGNGFEADDIGRCLRFQASDGNWYWSRITGHTSTTVVSGDVLAIGTEDSATLPDTNAQVNWRIGSWSEYTGWPSVIGIEEDRLVFGSTDAELLNLWGSVNAAYSNHSTSDPLVADDAINIRLAGGQLNDIQWVADGPDLLVGTEGSLRAVTRADNTSAFSATNVRQRSETVIPTSDIPALLIESMLIFFDLYNSRMYEAAYASESEGYVARELSAINEHLFGLGITAYAYQSTPARIIWCVTEAGDLLAATYDRDQKIFGVSLCDVGGVVESIITLPGTNKDGDNLWMVVRRTVDGNTVRYVEVLSSFYRESYSVQTYPVYAHSAGVYEGAATDTVTGLSYLEGETVGVWADGVDVGDVTISSAQFTLPEPFEAETIVWGLRQLSDAQTLRLADYGQEDGSGLGRSVVLSNALVDYYQTADLMVGTLSGVDPVRPEQDAEVDPYAPALLRTGSFPVPLDDSWNQNGVCVIQSNSMHPATVRSITTFPEGEP